MRDHCFPVVILVLLVLIKYGKADYCTGELDSKDTVTKFRCPQPGQHYSMTFCCGEVDEQVCCDIYQLNSVLFIVLLVIGLISGIISITLGLCYSVSSCPFAKWSTHQGTVIQLPQGAQPTAPPGVRMSMYDMEMVPIARQPYIQKGYDTQQPHYPQMRDVTAEKNQLPTYGLN